MRALVTTAAAVALMTVAARATAAPRAVLTRDVGVIDSLDASPDGRVWVRGVTSEARTFVFGPGDQVLPLAKDAPPPWQVAPHEVAGRLALADDGTLVMDGKPAPVPESLLHALGPKTDRRTLAYDEARDRYALLRSRRPRLTGGYDDAWSLVWFTRERVLDDVLLPEEIPLGGVVPLAVANGVAWVAYGTGVLRWQDGSWTEFGNEHIVKQRRDVAERDRESLITTAVVLGVGNAAYSSLFSLPVSLAGRQRFVPTAVTSYVGSFPALLTAGSFALGANMGGGGKLSDAISVLAYTVGVASLPVVALVTYGTGELGFRGTNEGGYLGALGGAASGALVWTIVSAALPDNAFRNHLLWLLPIGGSFISSASTAGYLWAGDGFRR